MRLLARADNWRKPPTSDFDSNLSLPTLEDLQPQATNPGGNRLTSHERVVMIASVRKALLITDFKRRCQGFVRYSWQIPASQKQ